MYRSIISLRSVLGTCILLLSACAPSGTSQATQGAAQAVNANASQIPTATTLIEAQSITPSATATLAPTATIEPTATLNPTSEPNSTPLPTATTQPTSGPVTVNGRVYDAYIEAAGKEGQAYHYSCQFDGAWVILQTYGIDVTVDELIAKMPKASIEPYFEETADGFVIYGGDLNTSFSGDIDTNFLARSNGTTMIPIFASYGLEARPVTNRGEEIEAALQRGELVWTKATADFKPWRPATWIMPDGSTQVVPLGNEHTVVVIGYNSEGVVVRDTLGPTKSNMNRAYEYDVPWEQFMRVWGEYQHYDALAVARPTQ